MKKIQIIIALSFMVMFTACGTNIQKSSMEEARYSIERLPDFQKLIQYFSVESNCFPWAPATTPTVYQSDPELAKERTAFIHGIIYKTKDENFKLVLLNDSRPPKIVATKDF